MSWRDDDHERSGSFTRRSLVISSLQVAGFGVLAGRLFQLQVLEGQYYAPLAENNRVDVQFTAPIRGRIFDRKGIMLAGNEEAFAVTVIPALTGDMSKTLKEIGKIVPMTADEVQALLAKEKDFAFRQLVIDKALSFEQVAALNVLAPQLPGVECQTTYQRRYYNGASFSHIVGYMGRVAEHALDDDPALRLPGMRIGKIGIELGCEKKLRGRPGRRRYEVDARGRIIRDLGTRDSVPGQDIRLTIDAELQARVMGRLSGERRAALVVMNVENGDVLSMASVPTYDADAIARSISKEDWQKLSKAKDQPMFNRAIRGLYPPGSTLKMVTALAALEKGVIGLKEKITCTGSFKLAGQNYRCWKQHGHGPVNLHQALRESCDCYFYEAALRCGITTLSETAKAFGLGATFDCGLPLQKKGVVPTPDWKRWAFNASWLDGETVLTGIGQGYVSATPLQLAVMTARLATGRPVQPRLVLGDDQKASGARELTFSDAYLIAVRRGMQASIYESGGTGHRVQIAGANFSIAGKTGTSQVRRNKDRLSNKELPWEQRDHALFTCYFPIDRPRYCVACVVEHGGSGGKTAAPLVRDVIKDIVDYDRTADADPGANSTGGSSETRLAAATLPQRQGG